MSAIPEFRMTPQEYLEFERASEVRHQYFAGEVFAMGGASLAHNRIVLNIGSELNRSLAGGPCEPFVTDMRVKVDASGLYTYPDVVVVCEQAKFEDGQLDSLLNPRVIIEVLSPSTEAYDRGNKFEHYRKIDSLQDYLLVSQDRIHVEHFSRTDENEWLLKEAFELESVLEIASIQAQMIVKTIYERVEFDGK